ncbi:MAG: iron-containing alcohol dehydrogenase [Rhizobiaceae bacterium]
MPGIFSISTAQDIRFGRGCAKQAAEDIATLGKNIFLVHGANPARAVWLVDALEREGIRVGQFSCASEPEISLIENGVLVAREFEADVIVSLGGGSVIDAGKAIAALVPADKPILDYLEVVGKGLALEQPPLPFVAIPTTAGTGAEVTRNAVIGVPDHRRKVSLRDVRMLPNLAIIDPALTDNTSRSVTLASGLDAVTQVIESYVSCKANRFSDALCRDAIPLGLLALVRLMQGEDEKARDDLAWVSHCGGLALANSGLGAVHGFAGVIGGRAAAPHGVICGILLPHVLKSNFSVPELPTQIRERFHKIQHWIADALGVESEISFDELAAWSRRCGLPSLSDVGVSSEDFDEIAIASLSSSSMKGNPVYLQESKLIEILRTAS